MSYGLIWQDKLEKHTTDFCIFERNCEALFMLSSAIFDYLYVTFLQKMCQKSMFPDSAFWFLAVQANDVTVLQRLKLHKPFSEMFTAGLEIYFEWNAHFPIYFASSILIHLREHLTFILQNWYRWLHGNVLHWLVSVSSGFSCARIILEVCKWYLLPNVNSRMPFLSHTFVKLLWK